MPLSKADRAKGGRRPASDRQKEVARQWMLEHCPWQKSTGPRTSQGKAIVSCNPHKTFFRRIVKAAQVLDFQAECQLVEKLILFLRSQLEASGVQYQLTIKRRSGGENLKAWAYFAVRIEFIGDESEVSEVWTQLHLLLQLCGW